MKIFFFLIALIVSGCTTQKENLDKHALQVIYYGSLYDIENVGNLKFYTRYSIKDILHIKKDSESSYIKAYYANKKKLVKAEKFQGNQKMPSKIFFINENNINYKTKYRKKELYIDCDLVYKKKNTFKIKTTTCSDGTKEVLTTKSGRIFISYFKYDKIGNIVKKEISTKRGIEMYENEKLIEIRNEIE